MRLHPGFRSFLLTLVVLITGTALFSGQGSTQDSPPQQRPVWEVQLARNAQASSNITIQNQCQQPHTFTVTAQQTPFLQFLAAPTVNVPGNSSHDLPVRFNTNGMNAGQYQGTVVVKCETCGKEKTCKQDREILPLRLTVLENAQPPQPIPTPTPTPNPISNPVPTPIPEPTPTPTPTPSKAIMLPTPTPSPSPSPCAPAPSPTKYTVKNLGPLSASESAHCIATGVNDAGNVIGVCNSSYFGASGYGSSRAFRTEPGEVIKNKDELGVKKDDLGLPEGIKFGASYASAINAAGHVVGSWASASAVTPKAFWHAGSKDSKMINLNPAKSLFTTSHAFGLNNHDVVVGAAFKPFDKPGLLTFGGRAVIWPHADPESMKDLNEYMDPSSKKDWKLVAAFGINDEGHIVGRALDLHSGKFHAFLLKGAGAKPIDLGALAEDGSPTSESSAAYAINACGDTDPPTDKVVGYTLTKKGSHYGFVWTESSSMKDMGTLPPYSDIPYLMESFATAINKKGEVVGAAGPGSHNSPIFDSTYEFPGSASCVPYELAVWYNGKELKDLNELIPASPGWKLQFANGINDKGQIAGSGYYKCFVATGGTADLYSHLSHAVLLTPAGLTSTASAPGAESSSTAACPLSLPSGGYIFDNWNVCGVKNGPTTDTTFTIAEPSLVTFIATYHWNYGKGALPTKGISLKDSAGTVYGPWPVITSTGSGGAANVNWECHPGITLPTGTYTVIDPDPATWSQNDGSGNSGFVRVAGSPKK